MEVKNSLDLYEKSLIGKTMKVWIYENKFGLKWCLIENEFNEKLHDFYMLSGDIEKFTSEYVCINKVSLIAGYMNTNLNNCGELRVYYKGYTGDNNATKVSAMDMFFDYLEL